MLAIADTLEHSSVVYVSPFLVRELDLKVDFVLHNGFQARDNNGEVIIKMVSWKDDYYGSIDDGTEVPRLEGVAVLIRSDFYDQLLKFYNKKSWFVLSQDVTDT